MKVLICGSRDWKNREIICSWLSKLQNWRFDTVIEGEAKGADSIARDEAEKMGVVILKFPADWNKYHKAAGVIRNKQMLEEGRPDLIVAFHDNIENSKGTKDTIQQGLRLKIPVILVDLQGSYNLKSCQEFQNFRRG